MDLLQRLRDLRRAETAPLPMAQFDPLTQPILQPTAAWEIIEAGIADLLAGAGDADLLAALDQASGTSGAPEADILHAEIARRGLRA